MIKAVIFDIDNTLYCYDTAHTAAMEALHGYARAELGISPAELDTLLNLDGKGRSQPESVIAKSARPSVLDSLKRPVPPRSPEKKPKQHEEVR